MRETMNKKEEEAREEEIRKQQAYLEWRRRGGSDYNTDLPPPCFCKCGSNSMIWVENCGWIHGCNY